MSYRIYMSSAFTALGGFVFGYHTGVISGVITMPAFISNFTMNNGIDAVDHVKTGGIVGVFLFGCFFGSLLSGQTSDRFSRKFSIVAFSIIFVISAILQIVYATLWLLFVARFIAGEFTFFFKSRLY